MTMNKECSSPCGPHCGMPCAPAPALPHQAMEVQWPGITIRVKRELFSFQNEQQWVNKAKSWYANCGVSKGFYLTVDAAGHVMHMGKCFMEATAQGLYPITVYELQTNWASGA